MKTTVILTLAIHIPVKPADESRAKDPKKPAISERVLLTGNDFVFGGGAAPSGGSNLHMLNGARDVAVPLRRAKVTRESHNLTKDRVFAPTVFAVSDYSHMWIAARDGDVASRLVAAAFPPSQTYQEALTQMHFELQLAIKHYEALGFRASNDPPKTEIQAFVGRLDFALPHRLVTRLRDYVV